MRNIENLRPAVQFPQRGGSRGGREVRVGHSRRPWQPRGRSGSTGQHRAYLPPNHDHQAPSCYLTFIRRAVLWDKGVYHCLGLTHRDGLPTLCPRFMGHMRAFPEDLRPPRFLSSHPRLGAQQWGHTSGTRPLAPQKTQNCGGAGRSLQYTGLPTSRRCAVVLAPTPPSPPPSRVSSSSCCPTTTPPRPPETHQRAAEGPRCLTPNYPLPLALREEEENAGGDKDKGRQMEEDEEELGCSDREPVLSATQSPSFSPNPSPNPDPEDSGPFSAGEGALGSITPAGSFSRSGSLSDFSRPPSSRFSRSTDLSSRQSSRAFSGCVIQSDDEDHDSSNGAGNNAAIATADNDDNDDNDDGDDADDADDDSDLNHQGQQSLPSHRPPSRLPPLPVTPFSVAPPSEPKSSQPLEPTHSPRTSGKRSSGAVGLKKVPKENVDDLVRNQLADLTPHPSLGSVSLATWRTSSRCLSGLSKSASSASNVDQSEWTSQRWSRLPPIMPSGGVSRSGISSCSQVSAAEHKDDDDDDDDDDEDDLFAELEAVAPRTGSCMFIDHPESSGAETGPTSPVIALSPGLAALTVGCASGGLGSLSRVHLLMLDRPGPELDLTGSPLDPEWDTPIPLPADGTTTSWSDFRGEDYHQTGASRSVSENSVLLEGHAAHSMTCSEKGSPSPSSWLLRTSFSDLSVGSQSGEDGEDLEGRGYTCLTPTALLEQPIESSPQPGVSGREETEREDDHPEGGGGQGGEEDEEEEEEERTRSSRRRRRTERLNERRKEKEREEKRSKVMNVYSKLQQENRQQAGQGLQNTSCSRFEDFAFLAKYCIFNQEKLAIYKHAFQAADSDGDGYLSCFQVLLALKEIIPSELLSEEEEIYVYRILELVDVQVAEGVMMDERLFAVVASLAHKVATLDDFMRSLISQMDFRSLEMRLYKAKQLFLFLLEAQTGGAVAPTEGCISTEQLLLELKAGGLRRDQEEAVLRELTHLGALDLLDFLAYLPLFILIHNSVVNNPLDDTPNL